MAGDSFRTGKSEAQRGELVCPRSHFWCWSCGLSSKAIFARNAIYRGALSGRGRSPCLRSERWKRRSHNFPQVAAGRCQAWQREGKCSAGVLYVGVVYFRVTGSHRFPWMLLVFPASQDFLEGFLSFVFSVFPTTKEASNTLS